KLRRVRFAEDDKARIKIALCECRVMSGAITLIESRAIGRYRTLKKEMQIFQQEGHTLEKAIRQAACDLCARFIIMFHDDGIDLRIDSLRASNCFIKKLRRRHLSALHQRRKAEAVIVAVIRKAAHQDAPISCVYSLRKFKGAGLEAATSFSATFPAYV